MNKEATQPAPAGDAGTPPAADPATPSGDANPAPSPKPDDMTGLKVDPAQGNLFDKPEPAKKEAAKEPAKVEPVKEEPKKETKDNKKDADKGKEEPESKPKTIQEMGFTDISADQQAVAELSTELGITFDNLRDAVVDGRLDVSKLEGLSPRDAQLLKTTVDAEVIKLVHDKNTRRAELHAHVGSETNFNAMVKWVNTAMKTDEALRTEVTELRNMMSQGGRQAELAVKSLFDKFKADPSTSLPLASDTAADSSASTKGSLTKRQSLDVGWDNFKDKHGRK